MLTCRLSHIWAQETVHSWKNFIAKYVDIYKYMIYSIIEAGQKSNPILYKPILILPHLDLPHYNKERRYTDAEEILSSNINHTNFHRLCLALFPRHRLNTQL